MSINIPPSSNVPNFHDGLGLDAAKTASVVTQATRDHLKQQGITLKDPLGKPGACGIVLAATDAMQRPLAAKVVLRPLDRQSRKRHQRECEILSINKVPTDLRPVCYQAHKVTAPKDEDLAKDAADGVQPYLVMSRIDGKEDRKRSGLERGGAGGYDRCERSVRSFLLRKQMLVSCDRSNSRST